MPDNSRAKGQRGEIEVRNLFQKHGFAAHRGQQFKGTSDSPDVVTGMEGFHVEVKLRQNTSLYPWLEQCATEAKKGDQPLLFYRKDRKPWVVVLYAEDFMKLMDELYTKE